MTKLRFLYILGFLFLVSVAPIAYQIDRAAQSLPALDGEVAVGGLTAPAEIQFDQLAIPTVIAANRVDAYRTLGFLHARDRLFQMDLMRRKSAGRLAELFGETAVSADMAQRYLQLERAAVAAVAALPGEQRAVLEAYTAGVNGQLALARELPPEFRILRYRPEPWRLADTMLVALGMFQTLALDQAQDERMLRVMQATLPSEVVAFLTPDTDDYVKTYVGGELSWRPQLPVPVAALAQLLAEGRSRGSVLARVEPDPVSLGSNNWAVSGRKTLDGRAIVANDMHLPLGIPNVWYRARLHLGSGELQGLTLPGVPVIVAGSNGRIAWGFTNLDGDFVDLVRLERNPREPSEYRTPRGWRRFESHKESITVKDRQPVTFEVLETEWGPVAPEPLQGNDVALRWTALDPVAVNLGLIEMDRAQTLMQGIAVLNRAGSPPQNVVLADDLGHIGWTFMGALPRRRGFDGSVARSWADGQSGWDGYLPPEELPRLLDPPEGYLATANNRTVGRGYPHVIGHSFSNGYRAFRIRQSLGAKENLTERDMLALQLDTTSEFYEFYRQLAMDLLPKEITEKDRELADARQSIAAWNGRLDPDSLGIGVLIRWRKDLARAIFGPIVQRCASADRAFVYQWRQQETPLRELLRRRLPETMPAGRDGDWASFLRRVLRDTARAIKAEHGADRLANLPWGQFNALRIRHPLSSAFPPAALVLDMPEVAGACNSFCLRVLHAGHGASERFAVSPNHPEDGILHMPGGQSGHPFSPHYRDQMVGWANGQPTPFLPGEPKHKLRLVPVLETAGAGLN